MHDNNFFTDFLVALYLEVFLRIKIATLAAGVVFLMLSSLWPCSWMWNEWNQRCECSFAPLLCYMWSISLLYVGTIGALAVSVSEHYDCIRFCNNCTFDATEYKNCAYAEMPLWVLVGMAVLAIVVLVVGCSFCCFQQVKRATYGNMWNFESYD